MMNAGDQKKISSSHLKRKAFLYVRQSTLRQVYENQESTQRQYALQQKAVELGWGKDQVEVIDTDLGISAAGKIDREGFSKLVAEVGMGHAGLVMGLEVSRLARCSSDWHKLLEICALTKTLILDEDGLYDPAHFNDRLLLGLKGSMSEAELHILNARLQGGLLNKARKGELYKKLPIGYVYSSELKIIKDPDKQVQNVIKLLFKTYRKAGTAHSAAVYFRKHDIKFPKRLQAGPDKDKLVWGRLTFARVYSILHNPCYAGAYTFGRSHVTRRTDGSEKFTWRPQEEWWSFIKDAHPGYITWKEYEENIKLLKNSRNYDNSYSSIREGPALLQGLALCGHCGRKMGVNYYKSKNGLVPRYSCYGAENQYKKQSCQSIHGQNIDDAVSKLLLEIVKPEILELTMGVQEEIKKRIHEVEKVQKQQVERAQYEADLAKRRYMQVDPENRLVADTLEKEWNDKLKTHKEACVEYERQRQTEVHKIDNDIKNKIMLLTSDFPVIWNDPKTSYREKKKLVRLMIEDVTLLRDRDIQIHIRFKGGNTRSLSLPIPFKDFVSPELVKKVDKLLDSYTYSQLADLLNEQGCNNKNDNGFNARRVKYIRQKYGLKTRRDRLKEKGLLTLQELSNMLCVKRGKLSSDLNKNILKLKKYKLCDYNYFMYEKPDQNTINDYMSLRTKE